MGEEGVMGLSGGLNGGQMTESMTEGRCPATGHLKLEDDWIDGR